MESPSRYIQVFGFSLSAVIGSRSCTRVDLSAVFKTKGWAGSRRRGRWPHAGLANLGSGALGPGALSRAALGVGMKWARGSALGHPFG